MNTPIAERALKRLLANGRLTALPKRPADQRLLATLAASRFDAGKTYAESAVNERLERWLEAVSEPHGIDHVTLRRLVVDSRLLCRTTSGSSYAVNPEKAAEIASVRALDPAGIAAGLRDERERRRRERAA